jgi:hypothetical protein
MWLLVIHHGPVHALDHQSTPSGKIGIEICMPTYEKCEI